MTTNLQDQLDILARKRWNPKYDAPASVSGWLAGRGISSPSVGRCCVVITVPSPSWSSIRSDRDAQLARQSVSL
jgi:hypothetical protein